MSPPFGFFFLFSFGTCRCCYCCWIFLDGTLKERTECCKLKLEKGAELICMYHSVCKYAFSLVLFLIAAARCCFVSSRCFCCCSLCPVLMLFNCRLQLNLLIIFHSCSLSHCHQHSGPSTNTTILPVTITAGNFLFWVV